MRFGRCRSFTLGALFALASLLSAGCGGEPPDKEMQQAQAAIDTARAAGAEKYALQELIAAEEALKNARAAVDQRDYRLALNHALDSRERAESATKQTADAKAAERSTSDRALLAATTALTNIRTLMKTGEGGRVPPRLIAAARAAAAEAEQRVQEARAALERGEFSVATAAATAASDQLRPLIGELTAATTPASRRRR